VELWIVGSGSPGEEADFERQCWRSRVTFRLRWLRGLPHASMPRLYDGVRASGGVMVSTSRGESFGMAVAEAMARGCAAVAPRRGPFPEFITDGVEGRLYRAGNDAQAAEAVLRLLADTETRLRLGANARERILSSHATSLAMSALAQALQAV
jgi:glycosyltransferase involved in cell wall biosynthesis